MGSPCCRWPSIVSVQFLVQPNTALFDPPIPVNESPIRLLARFHQFFIPIPLSTISYGNSEYFRVWKHILKTERYTRSVVWRFANNGSKCLGCCERDDGCVRRLGADPRFSFDAGVGIIFNWLFLDPAHDGLTQVDKMLRLVTQRLWVLPRGSYDATLRVLRATSGLCYRCCQF